ncbi:hypothetical protein SPHINGO391_220019 [Sphingomonas aurantiaca]|uniref:Uncharacterized protein n=1 Tax=Sphingomonas aurantiaca TaxID=185949 RepID=A0A5E7Y0T2_9SPHN|nr:hypothetical protein SPHINGO391_220019 [Sphingomonas aurantiaca]
MKAALTAALPTLRPYLVPLMCVQNVSGPLQGHWNRVHAGRAVSQSPAAPARGPGKRPYTHVDPRLARLPEAPLPSSAGPLHPPRFRRSWRSCALRH